MQTAYWFFWRLLRWGLFYRKTCTCRQRCIDTGAFCPSTKILYLKLSWSEKLHLLDVRCSPQMAVKKEERFPWLPSCWSTAQGRDVSFFRLTARWVTTKEETPCKSARLRSQQVDSFICDDIVFTNYLPIKLFISAFRFPDNQIYH